MRRVVKSILVLMFGMTIAANQFAISGEEPELPIFDRSLELLLKNAERALKEKNYDDAQLWFTQASQVKLFEAPNFEPYLGLSEVLCAQNKIESGRRYLDASRRMLDIFNGNVKCGDEVAQLSSNIMCAETYYDLYVPFIGKNEIAEKLEQRFLKAKKACKN